MVCELCAGSVPLFPASHVQGVALGTCPGGSWYPGKVMEMGRLLPTGHLLAWPWIWAFSSLPGLFPASRPVGFLLPAYFPPLQRCVLILPFPDFTPSLWIFNRKKRLKAHRDSIPRYLHTALPSSFWHLPSASHAAPHLP